MWVEKSIRTALIACAAGLLGAPAFAIEFTAGVDRNRAGEADPIRLVLSIAADENIPEIPVPELVLDEFHVEGPSLSTRVEMVNFRTTFKRELTYTLYGRRPGNFVIGPARIELGGRIYETEPLEVEIVPGSLRQAPLSGQGEPAAPASIADNLFLRVRSDRGRAYVGQQVTLDYDLCYHFKLRNVGFKQLPTFAGFWVKELFAAQTLEGRRETIRGSQFDVAPLRRVALFPTRAGTHQVEAMVLSCEIHRRRRQRSVFDSFGLFDGFGQPTQSVTVRSEAVEIEALPLPLNGRPPDFSGAVGRFALDVEAMPTAVPVGDPVTLRVEVSGRGNVNALNFEALEGLPGFEVYEPRVETTESAERGVYGGSRTFEYILIPERGGQLEIPALRLSYFDPHSASYQVAQSTPIQIASHGGETALEGSDYGLSRKTIEEVGRDIRHIKPDLEELEDVEFLYQKKSVWILPALLPLAFAGLLIHQRHQQRLEGDLAYARRRRARGEADKRLRRARQLLGEDRGIEFYAEIQRALLSFLADHLNLAAAGLTRETWAASLEDRGVGETEISEVGEFLDRCDFVRFAPTAPERPEMEKAQQEAAHLIASLGRRI